MKRKRKSGPRCSHPKAYGAQTPKRPVGKQEKNEGEVIASGHLDLCCVPSGFHHRMHLKPSDIRGKVRGPEVYWQRTRGGRPHLPHSRQSVRERKAAL